MNRVTPGLAKKDPTEIESYLKPLIDHAKKLVPEQKWSTTPIFLFATAGMRVIPEERQNAILSAVQTTLKQSQFRFDNPKQWARVISGDDEGVYGWVTANYLKRILFMDNAKQLAVGALDLGGASLQITFLIRETPKKEPYSLKLPDNEYNLYTHSFLSYGQDMTTEWLFEYAAEMARMRSGVVPQNIPFPCYLNGYKEKAILQADGQEHTIVGTGDYSLCSEYQTTMLGLNAACPTTPCSMNGTYQPKHSGVFYAMSGFFYTADFFKFASGEKIGSPSLFKESATQFCAKSWDTALKENPNVGTSHLKLYCLTSSYIYNILTQGFGFAENDKRIYFTSKVHESELNWALGGLISHVSMLDNTNSGSLVSPLFSLSTLSFFFLTLVPLLFITF